jgi:hypothetical protein
MLSAKFSVSIHCLALGFLLMCPWAQAQELNNYANTLSYNAEQGSPAAKLSDVSWLTGYWQGEVWGGVMEEIWSAPLAGSMQASFKFAKDKHVQFYELITLFEQDNSLVLRLKHFSSDLRAWEEKDDFMEFKLVKLGENAVYFDGYTYRLVGPNELHVFVVIDEQGKKSETSFVFQRR